MTTPAETPPTRQRADIQGLRAVAVALVLAFHLWPTVLPGGFVGVDVFFVVSGFLITAHLLSELQRTGTVSLPGFWARRARRLLPAALTVLMVTAVAALAFAPVGLLPSYLSEVLASALYVENWSLASRAVDYLAAEAPASPAQHFWSLSVEEQFYLAWPVLLLAAAAVAGRRWNRRTVIAVVLGVLVAVSLAWSVVFAARDAAQAYFATPTRAWEFGLGGLLAALHPWADRVPAALRRPPARAVLAWAGLGAIAGAALLYDTSTAFPGAAALLPCLGALAVLAAVEPEARWSPTGLLRLRPLQTLGDLSYGVYLWHWPLIVLLPAVLGRGLGAVDQWAIVALSIVLAWATARYVETPVRRGAIARRLPSVTFGATAVGMAVVVGVAGAGLAVAGERLSAEQSRIEALVDAEPDCLGAAALAKPAACADEGGQAQPLPDAALAAASPERCISPLRDSELRVCEYGAAEPDRTLALLGDSHAEQWLPALQGIVLERNWRLVVLTKSSCAFGPDRRIEPGSSPEVLAQMNESCRTWNEQAVQWLEEHPEADTIVTSTRARNQVVPENGLSWQQTAISQYHERWRDLPRSVQHVIVLRDTPRMQADVLACVTAAGESAAGDCAVPAAEALVRDPAAEAAQTTTDPRVELVDLSSFFCTADLCSPVVGGVLAYRDSHHMSWVFARTLGPYLWSELNAVLASG